MAGVVGWLLSKVAGVVVDGVGGKKMFEEGVIIEDF